MPSVKEIKKLILSLCLFGFLSTEVLAVPIFEVTASDSTVTVGVDSSATVFFTVKNVSSTSLTLSSVQPKLANSETATASLTTSNCSLVTLAQNKSCTEKVQLVGAVEGSNQLNFGAYAFNGAVGSKASKSTVVEVGGESSTGDVKCWGQGNSGRLGQGNRNNIGDATNEMGDNLNAIDLGLGRTAKVISAGEAQTCAVLDDDSVKCWGRGNSGRLGQGNTNDIGDAANEMGDNLSAIELGTGRYAKNISTGKAQTCVLLDNNSVKCWGRGNSGRLGQGNTDNIGDEANEMGDNLTAIDLGTGRTAKEISTGKAHTCALLDNNSVKCWGRGNSGRLGQGNTDNIGDLANQMGDSLSAIDLGTGRTAKAIATGDAHTCALLDNSSVKCWGRGKSGRLGQGNTNNIGDAANEMGDNLSAIDLGTGRTAKAITIGEAHTCALLDDNSVKCWGLGSSGQLGQGNTSNIGDAANEMGDNLSAIDLGTGRTAKAVSAGTYHTCAWLDNDSVKCWGAGGQGRLGQGNTNNIGDTSNEMGDNLSAIDLGSDKLAKAISAGDSHTCSIISTGN